MASASRKRKLEDASDDYSGGIETEINKFMSTSNKKHTLDSDDEEEDEEEYNKKKYDIMPEDDIEGQEDSTQEFDGETKLTPFNMKDELEEGYFDGSGMYIWNKRDASEIKDSWLDSIDWMKVKKPDGEQPNTSASNRKDDESSSETDEEVDTFHEKELFKQVLVHLKPGESILKAIKRLGGGKQLSASERLKQKKLAKKQQGQSPPSPTEDEKAGKDKLIKLTELANKIMSVTGNMDVYDETYESLSFKLTKDLKPVTTPVVVAPPPPKAADDDGLDMFGDSYE